MKNDFRFLMDDFWGSHAKKNAETLGETAKKILGPQAAETPTFANTLKGLVLYPYVTGTLGPVERERDAERAG